MPNAHASVIMIADANLNVTARLCDADANANDGATITMSETRQTRNSQTSYATNNTGTNPDTAETIANTPAGDLALRLGGGWSWRGAGRGPDVRRGPWRPSRPWGGPGAGGGGGREAGRRGPARPETVRREPYAGNAAQREATCRGCER